MISMATIATALPRKEGRSFLLSKLPLRSRRILVVEDDVDLRIPIERVTRSIDPELELDWASEVSSACWLLQHETYELVLADYNLGEGPNGVSLYRHCARAHPRTRFALMSAYLLRDDVRSAIGGPFPFLPKPFTMTGCRTFLREALAHPAVRGRSTEA
ncbi:MAG: response regulator [Myxococcota bacterium]